MQAKIKADAYLNQKEHGTHEALIQHEYEYYYDIKISVLFPLSGKNNSSYSHSNFILQDYPPKITLL
jgi:hypothetical protein